MRVIAGLAKGRPLHAPRGGTVRPTSDKVKGALFSVLEAQLYSRRVTASSDLSPADVWKGMRWLDLYSGSGALAIEALSRGAAWADLVERSSESCRTIRRNLSETGLETNANVFCLAVGLAIAEGSEIRSRSGYDIIAADPPYADPALVSLLYALADSPLLRDGGLLAVEHSRRALLAEAYGPLGLIRQRVHGDTTLSVYIKQENIS